MQYSMCSSITKVGHRSQIKFVYRFYFYYRFFYSRTTQYFTTSTNIVACTGFYKINKIKYEGPDSKRNKSQWTYIMSTLDLVSVFTRLWMQLTHLCPPLRSTFAVRETANWLRLSLHYAVSRHNGGPRVPPLKPFRDCCLSDSKCWTHRSA